MFYLQKLINQELQNPRILILGCGWLGQALAHSYRAMGCTVYATTTQEEKYHRLKADGIFAILADFDQEFLPLDFPSEVDYVINSIPATKRHGEGLLEARFRKVRGLLEKMRFEKHLFFSSIGVYPDRDGIFDETYSLDVSDSNLQIGEKHMLALPDTLIYRLGGLFGEDRIFAKYFQHKICTTGYQLSNFIHVDDVVQLVQLGLSAGLEVGIYNIVAPGHPQKKEVIEASAKKYGYALPLEYQKGDDYKKWVSGLKIKSMLNYTFLYPSPLEF